MSLFTPSTLNCPHCGQSVDVEICASVNADRRPDLRAAILDESFQATTCPHCRMGFRLEPQMNYLDIGRGQWVAAFPRQKIDNWPAIEADVQSSFDRAYGQAAGPAEREVGGDLQARLVFGWRALREKLVARELGIDDVQLELCKLALMRGMDDPPLPLGCLLRLSGTDDDTGELQFQVLGRKDEVLEELSVPRDLLDDIANAPDDWAQLRGQIDAGRFVDMQRLTRGG